MIVNKVEQLIGNTPVFNFESLTTLCQRNSIFGKIEGFNIGGSIKDRTALGLLRWAEKERGLRPGMTIVESSSGNLGVALAMLCAKRGYTFKCVVDPKTPQHNVQAMKAFGAETILCTTTDSNGGYQIPRINLAKHLETTDSNIVNLNQYENNAAVEYHCKETAAEIIRQMGSVDILVGCVSTGSHLSGISMAIKNHNPKAITVAVEPVGSVIFGGMSKPFLQNGTGLSFTPRNYKASVIDEEMKVNDIDAFSMCRKIASTEGLLIGGSSGAALHAAIHLKRQFKSPQKVLVILPDSGQKYLNTIFDDSWMCTNVNQLSNTEVVVELTEAI